MAAAGAQSLPTPPHWKGSQKAWQELSLYRQRRLSVPSTPRAFLPPRPRNTKHDNTLRLFESEHRQRHGLGYHHGSSGLPPGKLRFWQLPPGLRPQAQAYEDALCRKWAKRIAKTPQFARILHMLTINHFKNPGQCNTPRAWRIKGGRASHKSKVLKKLMGNDPESQSVARAGTIVRLPL